MKTVLQPLNEKAAKVVTEHADLLEGAEVEPLLLQLVAHVSAYKVILERWDPFYNFQPAFHKFFISMKVNLQIEVLLWTAVNVFCEEAQPPNCSMTYIISEALIATLSLEAKHSMCKLSFSKCSASICFHKKLWKQGLQEPYAIYRCISDFCIADQVLYEGGTKVIFMNGQQSHTQMSFKPTSRQSSRRWNWDRHNCWVWDLLCSPSFRMHSFWFWFGFLSQIASLSFVCIIL